jgi:DNA-binding NarL/FixJ family response regulator
MLSAINRIGYNPAAFWGTRKVLIADDERFTNDTNELILPTLVKCPPGDKLEINRADSFEEAEEALNSENYDVVVSDGHYRSINDSNVGSGDGDGLIIAKKAANKIGEQKVVLFSSDDSLKKPADNMGVHFIAKDYKKLSELLTGILNNNSSAGLDVKV